MLVGDSKTRFTSRVADYVAARPTYPPGVMDALRDQIGLTDEWAVVDIGAGTGISSALFLSHGHAMTAVEPNDAMRAAADAQFAGQPRYHSVAACAEATTLPDHSADLIVAAQAFHWFDHAAFACECQRLLTPRGRTVLMWNMLDPNATPAAAAYQAVLRRHATDLDCVEAKWQRGEAVAVEWFEPDTFVRIDVDNPQTYDAGQLFTRMASSSFMPQRGDAGFDAMRADLAGAFSAHAVEGRFTLPYVCKMFVGVPQSSK